MINQNIFLELHKYNIDFKKRAFNTQNGEPRDSCLSGLGLIHVPDTSACSKIMFGLDMYTIVLYI